MARSFTIVTDTSANLPADELEALGVPAIPFTYSYEGEEHTCLDTAAFEDGEGERYYAALKDGMRVTTSQITPQAFIDFFTPLLEKGEDILFVSMSSGISNSYNSSVAAVGELRERFPERKLFTVDTLAASLGEGKAVLRAAECRDKGMSIEETAETLLSERQSLYQAVMLDDLMFLHRGGRVSAPKALLGTVLGIRPILKGDEGGHLVVCGKTRGRKRALAALAEKYETLVDREIEQTVGVAYTDCPEDAFELKAMLEEIHKPARMLVVRYEPVTGSYVGPGTVALFFTGKDGVRNR